MRHLYRAVPVIGFALLLAAAGAGPAGAAQDLPTTLAATTVGSDTDPGAGDPMPGMDMPAEDMPADEPQHPENMPGMDMPAEDMPGGGSEHAEPVSRPRAAVLGTFFGINGAVLVAAAVMRRRMKNGNHPKRAPRVSSPTPA